MSETIRYNTIRSQRRSERRTGLTTFRQQRKAIKLARRLLNGKGGAR